MTWDELTRHGTRGDRAAGGGDRRPRRGDQEDARAGLQGGAHGRPGGGDLQAPRSGAAHRAGLHRGPRRGERSRRRRAGLRADRRAGRSGRGRASGARPHDGRRPCLRSQRPGRGHARRGHGAPRRRCLRPSRRARGLLCGARRGGWRPRVADRPEARRAAGVPERQAGADPPRPLRRHRPGHDDPHVVAGRRRPGLAPGLEQRARGQGGAVHGAGRPRRERTASGHQRPLCRPRSR